MGMKKAIEGDIYDLSRTGRVFHVSQYLSVASAASAYLELRTNTAEVVLLGWRVVASTEAFRIRAYEAPTIGTPGTTAVVGQNVNRALAATTPVMTLFSDPGTISGGTLLVDTITPSGANKVGGVAGENDIWTLAKNTKYLLRVENLGNSTSTAAAEFLWMEL